MYRQNYGLGSLVSTFVNAKGNPVSAFPTQYGGITPLMSGMSTPQTTRYGRKYGLSLPMVDYLNAPLPDISGLFAPLAGTAPVVDVPIEDVTEDEILQAIAAQDYYNQINQGGGGEGGGDEGFAGNVDTTNNAGITGLPGLLTAAGFVLNPIGTTLGYGLKKGYENYKDKETEEAIAKDNLKDLQDRMDKGLVDFSFGITPEQDKYRGRQDDVVDNIVDEVALTGDTDGRSGPSDTADDFDDGTMTGKAATSTGKTAIDSFFDAVDKTATKGNDSGGKSSDVGGTGSQAAADTSQGETGYGSCFIAGTKVTMADGTVKNIEDIKVRDIVKGHKGNNEVIKLDPTLLGERKLYSFNDNEHYFFTSEHPFMTEEGWKSIKPEKTKERDGIELYNQLEGELKIGDKLVTEKGLIQIKEIKSKEINDPKMPLYNFNVSNDNSYIADGYVVHNKGGGGGGKIVCTMMNESYGFGSFRNKIWLKHSKSLAPEYQKGYHKIFLPLVKYAKQDGVTNKIVKNILEHIAVHRTIDIRQESRNKIHLLGRIYRKVLEPICYLVGKHG
jgi:hypothetical protein